MTLCHRDMRAGDIQACVELVRANPVLGARYGRTIRQLPDAWRQLLQFEAKNATVFLAADGRETICGVGVTLMVRDDFLSEIKRPPHMWIGPELTRRTIAGDCPVLTGRQLRDGNSRGGLNLLCWESSFSQGFDGSAELQRYVMTTFIQKHQGYLLKEAISTHAISQGHLEFLFRSGAYLWDGHRGCYTTALRKPVAEIMKTPHVIGTHRDLELQRQGDWLGTWVGALFDYHLPMFGFTGSEQRMLSYALSGATDEELAGMLDISVPRVKKVWVSTYRRVEDHLPALIQAPIRSDGPRHSRGKEKRRRVLAYLRDHAEELRPVTRKLLPPALSAVRHSSQTLL